MNTIPDLFRLKEAWLMERILAYATAHGYTAYTSTLIEAWRASIVGLTEAIALGLHNCEHHEVELTVDMDLTKDPVARFGLIEARRHRERGVPLGMFLGFFIYYRQTFQDCLREFLPAGPERDRAEHVVVRLFDRMGAAFCVAWASEGENTVMNDMATTLRTMTNEKNRYLTFLESLTEPIFFLSRDGRLENLNHAAARLIHVTARPGQAYYEHRVHPQTEHLIGQPVETLIPWLGDFVQTSLNSPDGDHCSWKTLTDGDRTYRAIMCRQPDVSGKFTGFSLILQDETEQLTAHLQIARAKEELERTFDTISDLVFLVDAKHVLLRVNKALALRLGCNPKDLVGRTCQDILGCHRCMCREDSTFEENTPVTYPNIKGRFLVARNTLANSDGSIFGYVFVARDITPLEQIQATLHAVESKYKNIFDNAQEGIFQSTPEGTYLSLNPAMARIFGFESTEEMREYYTDIASQMYVHPEDRKKLILEGLQGDHVSGREIQFKRKDGSVFWAQIGGRVVRDHTGDILYFEGFVQDIHERKMLQSQLLQTQKLEAIGQLAAGIAHEINTPAQYVLNNMWFIKEAAENIRQAITVHRSILRDQDAAADLPAAANKIEESDTDLQLDFYLGELPAAIAETMQGLDRITAIVRSVKQFAHPGHDNIQPADLNTLVQDTVNVSRNEWKYVAELSTDLAPSLPAVPCLAHEIGQVLLNLIINAAHAIADKNALTQERGTIHIATRHDNEWVEIRITDSGTGIPEQARDHIFEPFFTTKPVGKGTGQGLYLAHRTVVGLHKGRLSFETTDGQGTTFIVRLPVTAPDQEPLHGM